MRAHHLPDASGNLGALVQELARRVRDLEMGAQEGRDRIAELLLGLPLPVEPPPDGGGGGEPPEPPGMICWYTRFLGFATDGKVAFESGGNSNVAVHPIDPDTGELDREKIAFVADADYIVTVGGNGAFHGGVGGSILFLITITKIPIGVWYTDFGWSVTSDGRTKSSLDSYWGGSLQQGQIDIHQTEGSTLAWRQGYTAGQTISVGLAPEGGAGAYPSLIPTVVSIYRIH